MRYSLLVQIGYVVEDSHHSFNGYSTPSHFKRVLPGEQLLLGNNASPLVIGHGHITSNPILILYLPRLTDQPLVMGRPCCESKSEQLYKKS